MHLFLSLYKPNPILQELQILKEEQVKQFVSIVEQLL